MEKDGYLEVKMVYAVCAVRVQFLTWITYLDLYNIT